MLAKPKGWGACPSFFVAGCREARTGRDCSYDQPAYNLAGALRGLEPNVVEEDEWAERRQELSTFIWQRSDDDVLAWFDRWLPRCMALVPRRRRESFLKGVYRFVVDEENDITI
jgi:hypothetical protein